MKKNTGKILVALAFGFGSLGLFTPSFAFAGNDGWTNINWHVPQRASGMHYLEHWLKGVQQRHASNKCNNRCDRHDHYTKVEYHPKHVSYPVYGRNDVNVVQSQEVEGHFKSVNMEQSVRVYVNGQLTSSDQQLSAQHSSDGARQVQQVSVSDY